MRLVEQRLPGVYLMELDLRSDERGFFARSFSEDELALSRAPHPLSAEQRLVERAATHTLRGMHYQAAPNGEVKIVACTAGAIYDVVVDLRVGSPTRFEWLAVELTPGDGQRSSTFRPGSPTGSSPSPTRPRSATGWARNFVPDGARGFRYDEPRSSASVARPARRVISERDRTYPDLSPEVSDA